MAKAKKGSKKVRAARKPTVLDKGNLAKVTAKMKVLAAKVKKDEMSTVEAIRVLSKSLASVRRIEIEAVLTKAPFNMNLGTVRRQIQEGRA